MPKKLSYDYVAEYIKNKGDELMSTEYINANTLLDIKCSKCNTIYKQTYGRITSGFLHAYCGTGLSFGGYKTPFKLTPIICKICKEEFKPKYYKTKLCLIACKKIAILWNGQWHYKQISKTQSLKQVEARDKIKLSIIEKYNYIPYIIKDMGKYNKKFVDQEFEIFCLMQIEY
jgi:hypothetical protein